MAACLTRAGGGGEDSDTETLLPVLVGLATVPFILGIKAYRASLLRRGQVREADRRPLIPLGIGLVSFVVLCFSLNSGVADRTLFEAQVAGTGDTAPAVLTFTVPVEHPGVRHDVDVLPRNDSDSALVSHRIWDDWQRDVTPTQAGDYLLTVTVLSPDVPQVHVWVGDDRKTDGHRIAGY